MLGLGLLLLVLLGGPVLAAATGMVDMSLDWRTANRDSAGIAPTPAKTPQAVIQVYGARAFGWRGAFAVHTWIAVKRGGASEYTTYQVMGWRHWRGYKALVKRVEAPDRNWFGAKPEIYLDLRGDHVEALIDRVEAAVSAYPYSDEYRTWPGPNSNTFTAWVAREVPELRLELPPTAVGKDYLGQLKFAASSPSGTGMQISFFGVLGALAALEEGLELHVLGLTLGVDPLALGIKLPGLGRLEPGR